MNELSFEEIKELSAKHGHKRAVLGNIELMQIDDDTPDLSWLKTEYDYDEETGKLTIIDSCGYSQQDADREPEQILKYILQDRERLESYGQCWWQIGVRAMGTIYLPYEVITGAGTKISFNVQHIESGGLWGIESDSDDSYLDEVKREERSELLSYLKLLNVVIPKGAEDQGKGE